jgi:capsular polysaccharide biosynthesis protein
MNERKIDQYGGGPGLTGRFFWRPRGFIRSLAEYRGGPIVDVKPKLTPMPGDDHPLVVAELPGGKVIGDTVLVATAEDDVIGGMQGLNMCREQENNWLLRRRRFRFPRRMRGTAFMLSMNGDNYFHWCFESLPRWRLLQEAGWKIAQADWVVLSHNAPAFQEQMLAKLGVPTEKFLRCSKWEVLQFDRLIVPSMPVPPDMVMHEWLCNFLRETFLPTRIPAATKNIYLSRRHVTRRRLANEAELEERLRQNDFSICAPETLSVAEQAECFASARLIVAPHGAGLVNLVFTAAGGQLIELFHPEIPNHCYERLAQARAVNYRAIIGRSTQASLRPDDREAEFSVDIDEVMRAVANVRSVARMARE